MTQTSQNQQNIQMNASELYREDVFTDRKVGSIRRLTPVNAEGEEDLDRSALYLGETQVMLGNQPLPISFEIQAGTLGEAAEKFGDAAKTGAEDTLKRLQQMQRDMQSSIVVPGQGGMGGAPGGQIIT